MIQTNTPIFYESRGNKEGVIFIEISHWVTTKTGKIFTVNDYVLNDDGTKEIYQANDRFRSNEQLNQLDDYLEANNDFTGLTSTETEWKKAQLGLLLDTQTNKISSEGKTIYKTLPNIWVLSE